DDPNDGDGDDETHLRFRISAEGYVTEYRYTPAGLVEYTIDYPAAAYTGGATEGEVKTWLAGITRTSAEVTQNAYDPRGNLVSTTNFSAAVVNANGDAVGDTAAANTKTTYQYDQTGKLLSSNVQGRNAES